MNVALEAAFPNLRRSAYVVTSPKDNRYNCVAWAMGESDVKWWPEPYFYWPARVPRRLSLAAFQAAFATRGYRPCANGSSEPGIEKITVYAVEQRPTHVARQLADGRWASKLGNDEDIEHELHGLISEDYGHPVLFLGRPTGEAIGRP